VNSHGVPEEKIHDMGSRRELITPRYLAYWIRSSRLMSSFNGAGVSEKAFLEALQRLSFSEDNSPKAKESNKTYFKPPGNRPSIGAGTMADIKEAIASEPRLSDFFPDMVHVTTDYIGADPRTLSHRNHEELLSNVLSSCTLQVVALFADERGIGAYVTSPTDDIAQETYKRESVSETESEEMTEVRWTDKYIKQHHNVPRYSLYTQVEAAGARPTYKKPKLPHITVRANAPHDAKEMGFATSEFHQLLLNGPKITIQGKSEAEGSPGSSSIFFPNVVNVGNFSALLFEHPVRFDSTYAYFYDEIKAPKAGVKTDNRNYGSPTGPRRPRPQDRRSM
jgi:uncharacterized protein YodC (DUF2158 family)